MAAIERAVTRESGDSREAPRQPGMPTQDVGTPRPGDKRPRGRLVGLITLALLLALAAAIFVVAAKLAAAEDLADVAGRDPDETGYVADLESTLNRALARGDEPVVITEAEMNRFLASRLALGQGGMFAESVTVGGVWVRFHPGSIELIVERAIGGRPHTVSMGLAYDKAEGRAEGRVSSVRFGSQSVPSGAVRLVLPAFLELRDALNRELALIEAMASVQLQEDQVVLTP